MKKIFRMALVFALAGAALLYTGCTKDYNEDINNLAGQVNDLKSLHATDIANLNSAISNLESSLKSADAAIEAAYKKADADLAASLKAAEDRIAANEDAIKGLQGDVKSLQDDVNANADDIKALNDDLTDLADKVGKDLAGLKTELTTAFQGADADLQKQINDNLQAAEDSLAEAKKLLLNELRAVVFVPELYYAGIEATEYVWTNYYRQEMVKADGKTSFEYNGVKFAFAKDAEIYAVDAKDKKGVTLDPIALSQLATAQYELNPSSFDVAKADWALTGSDFRYLVRGDEEDDEEEVWAPVFKSIVNEGGVATVSYMIENPWLLPTSVYANAEEIDWPEFEMDEIETVLEDNVTETAQYSGLVEFIANLADDIKKLIKANGGGNDNVSKDGLANYLASLESRIEQIYKMIADTGRNYGWNDPTIRTLQSEIGRLFQSYAMQQWQIEYLKDLATRNYKGTGYVPAMNLTATLEGKREIASDWEAIVSTDEEFLALAFDAATGYKTAGKGCAKGEHLYTSAYGAIGNKESVAVAYDKSLALDFIKIHMWDARNGESVKSLAELQKVYPKLDLTYELVSYTAGENDTPEDKYAEIKDGKFSAKTVSYEGEQTETYGAASVGKTPVVLVKLFNGEDLVLAGYFKIKIVKEVNTSVINLRDFGTVPYICSYDAMKTTWSQFSAKILDDLNITYESFQKNFEIDCMNFGPMWFRDKNSYNAVVYVKDEDDNYVKSGDFGTVKYIVDNNGGVVNDRFEWTLPTDTKFTKKLAPGTYTVYVKFNDGEYKVVYVALTVTVAEPASFKFGTNKIANEWSTDVNDDPFNTVKVNVHVPVVKADEFDYVQNTGKVLDYSRDLDHYFKGYEPGIDLAEGIDPVYSTPDATGTGLKWKDELTTKYSYSFDMEQPQVGKFQLFVKTKEVEIDDVKTTVIDEPYNLYAKYDTGKKTADGKAIISDSYLVAKLTDDSNDAKSVGRHDILTYDTNDIAKEILNLFAFDSKDPAEKLYANIHVDVTYGCGIEAGTEDFHARFLRPLAIDWKKAQEIEESAVAGDNISLVAYLEGITDWNNQEVIVNKAAKATDPPIWAENEVDKNGQKINMYKYYGFKSLKVDLANATRDSWSNSDPTKEDKLINVTPGAKLTLMKSETTGTGTDAVTTYSEVTDMNISISDFAKLKNYFVNYQNDEAYIGAFTLYIPVTVTYAWGEIPGKLAVKVKDTAETK